MSAPSGSFIMVSPAHVQELGPTVAILYARICWRAERCPEGWRATRAMLAEETGLTLEMIRTAGKVLRDRGLVTTARASSNDATLVWSPVVAGQADKGDSPISEMGESTRPGGGIPDLPYVGESPISSFETVETTTRPPSTPPDASGGEEQQGEIPLLSLVPEQSAVPAPDEEFDGFWRAYPRKVGKAKARTAYRAARRAASLEQIAAGLVAQLPDLRARDLAMVPHPTTWLNQHRWEDEPSHAAQPRTGPRNFDLERMMNRAAGHDTELPAPAARAIAMLEGRP